MQDENKLKIIRIPIIPSTSGEHSTLHSNVYLIGDENESILIDAGTDLNETRELIQKSLLENSIAQPKAVLLTHAHSDHMLGLRQFTDFSPTIYCHHNEIEKVKESINPNFKITTLNDGDVLSIADVNLIMIHGPGHTPGHLCVYIREEKVLIAGDNIVAEGTVWIGLPEGNMSDYINTLRYLKTLDIKRIGPGHGDWILNPYEQIEFVLNRRLHREIQIKSFLDKYKNMTSIKLTKLIYKDTISPDLFDFAQRTTEAHLAKLIKENIVTLDETLYSIKSG